MKLTLLIPGVCLPMLALFSGCEAKVNTEPQVVEKKETIVNPPAEKKVENNTTIVNPPAEKK